MADYADYQLVRVQNGAFSVRSVAHGETMHPGLGPAAEARTLYVEQVRLAERLRHHQGEFVIWDVGLGAGANILAVLSELPKIELTLRIVSFDITLDPLQFAFEHRTQLGYFEGYGPVVQQLLEQHRHVFNCGRAQVDWELQLGDFGTLLNGPAAAALPKPHLVLFDPWSPVKNPEMWTIPLFRRLHELLDPSRPCVLPTYSRSTLLRVALLIAGFWVGVGGAAGRKEETTIAANDADWIERPLGDRWLERVARSSSAEPLWEPIYRRAPLSDHTRDQLQRHPQFQRASLSKIAGDNPPG